MTDTQLTQFDASQDRFGRSVAARLSASTDELPHEISERLKAARMLALTKRNVLRLQTASAVSGSNGTATLNLGTELNGFMTWLASCLPLIALVGGLLAITLVQEEKRTNELAEVDVELLTDELPPAAYTDPGFAQFLRMNHGI